MKKHWKKLLATEDENEKQYIECKNISIGYSGVSPILEEVNCIFSQGDFIVLLGRNGQGKSTLLKTLVSIVHPISGDIHHTIPTHPINKCIAYVPSTLEIYGFLTVEEYIQIGRYQHTNFLGSLSKEDTNAVKYSMELIGIETLSKRQFSTLSDGEKQKCHIARAIAQEPTFLILDEPTSHLDLPMKRVIMELLHSISKTNIGVLLSTHDVHTVMEVSKTIWFVENHQLIVCNNDDEIPEQLDRFFIDSGIKKA